MARGGDSDGVIAVSARASVSRAVSAGDGRGGGFGCAGAWRGTGRRVAGVDFAERRVAGRRFTGRRLAGRFVILSEGFFDPGNGRAIYS